MNAIFHSRRVGARIAESCTAEARPGFTLAELLVVLAIIAMLISMSFIMFSVGMVFSDGLQAKANGAISRQSANDLKLRKSASAYFTDLRNLRSRKSTTSFFTDRHVVVFNDSVTNPQAEATRLASSYNMQVVHVYAHSIRGMAIRTDSYGLWKIRTDPAVAYVAQETKFHIASQTVPNGIRRINAPWNGRLPAAAPSSPPSLTAPFLEPINLVQKKSPQGAGGGQVAVVPEVISSPVAVIDSGVDATHPDLNVVFSLNLTDESDPNDKVGHGTHIAGIIGDKNNDFGVVGVNPGVPIWGIKVIRSDGSGNGADVVAAIDFLANNLDKIRVANFSLDSPFFQPANDAFSAVVNAGLVVTAAAGNDSDLADNHTPASCPDVITVAAFCDTDGRPGGQGPTGALGSPDDTFSRTSNYKKFIDIIAPGEGSSLRCREAPTEYAAAPAPPHPMSPASCR